MGVLFTAQAAPAHRTEMIKVILLGAEGKMAAGQQ
jgi:hypothetical protein